MAVFKVHVSLWNAMSPTARYAILRQDDGTREASLVKLKIVFGKTRLVEADRVTLGVE